MASPRAARWRTAAFGLALVLTLSGGARTAAEEPSLRALSPPDPAAPTPVQVSLYDVEIYSIDEREQTFEVGARLTMTWWDQRLAFDPELAGTETLVYQGEAAAEKLDKDVWWPSFEIADSRGPRERMHLELRIGSAGLVAYDERFNAAIMQGFDLGDFPFDSHDISLSIEPYTYDASAVTFVNPDEGRDPVSWQPIEWSILRSEVLVDDGMRSVCSGSGAACDEETPCGDGESCDQVAAYSSATLYMSIEREAAHYLWKIVLPLVLIICISSAVFWMDLERFPDPGDRMSVAFTAVLTVVAFDFVTADSLPKLGYTTLLDQVLILAYVFAAVNISGVALSTVLSRRRPAAADKLVTAFRWLYPPAFLVAVLLLVAAARF